MLPELCMMMIAVVMFMTIKWSMIRVAEHPMSGHMMFQWFLLTPTLDPNAFFFGRSCSRKHERAAFTSGFLCLALGCAMIAILTPRIATYSIIAAGWSAVCGLILSMHFGLLHLIVAVWQMKGRFPQPLMLSPWLAISPSDFWGKRWNTAFRDVAHKLILIPATKRFGSLIGSFLCFLFSGLIHEIAISVPANGGYGGPMLYFLIQWLMLLIERWLKNCSLNETAKRRSLRALAVTGILIPAPILFHSPFLTRVILPLVGVQSHAG